MAQTNTIAIKATFNPEKDELKIQQEIVFFNNSDAILHHIYLHNWANSFRDRKTPLSKRLIKDFKKEFPDEDLSTINEIERFITIGSEAYTLATALSALGDERFANKY